MRSERGKTTLRCAVYTRVSTEHGLEQEFNSLDNQREASEAYVKSQAHEGWMEPGPSAPRGGSKLARVIGLLERDPGATIAELIAATGWLAHTTRAALTALRKRGYAVAIDRSDDKRGSFYRIPVGETGLVEGPANSETARRKEQDRSEPQTHQAA